MKSYYFILLGILNINLGFSQLDLSQEWEIQDDLSYFDSESLEEIMDIEIPTLDLIRGIIVIHNGKIVSEEYYNGSSEDDIYNIFSVTKSYVSTLIGQAIDQGLLNNQYFTLDSFFPEYDIDYPQYVQLKDLLSMSSGYLDDYGEFPNYWYDATTEDLLGMEHIDGPGTFFYNNSACHIHSHILYYETGMTPKEFANINLFPYLGINNPDWDSGNSEISNGSSGLILNLRDMVKLGQLYLQDGYSSVDTQILSSEWIHETTSLQVETSWGWNGDGGYGYLWWLPDQGYLAWGLGGQFIVVIPELNLVVGTHSYLTDVPNNHISILAGIIYDQIVPLFDLSVSTINYYADWNLIGLPLEVEDNDYQILFPDAIENTLFSYDDFYISDTTLIQGEGYWLRFNEIGSTTISGTPINELTISLNEEWNLISGISTPINISDIQDPYGIIISGTVYGFTSGGYSNTETLEPGKGYWIRANNSGYIFLISNPELLPEECYLEPDVGPCDGVCPGYFYNQETEECEEFSWGCCEGLVPFDTLEECINTCE